MLHNLSIITIKMTLAGCHALSNVLYVTLTVTKHNHKDNLYICS